MRRVPGRSAREGSVLAAARGGDGWRPGGIFQTRGRIGTRSRRSAIFANEPFATRLTERNLFLNVDRAVAYGLDNTTPYFDHAGGLIRNNFVCLTPGLLSANRRASSHGSLIAWNSPGTQIDHNGVLLNGNEYSP